MIQMMLCFCSIFSITELNKSKTTWLPSVVILGKINILHWSISFKWYPKILWPSVERNVADKQAGRGRRPSVAV